MLFPTRSETVRCNQNMHKLALTDNCTQVLLPTQALSFAIATDSSNSNSHPSQPQPEPTTRVERWRPRQNQHNCQRRRSVTFRLQPTLLYRVGGGAGLGYAEGAVPRGPRDPRGLARRVDLRL